MKAMEEVVEENEVKPLTVEQLELYESESESDDSADEEEEDADKDDEDADEDEEDDDDEEEDDDDDVQEVVQLSGGPPIHSQRNYLVTIGEDEQITPQQSAMCLKVFDLDRMWSEGTSSSTTSPDCIGILRIFTNQFPEAKITSFLVLEEAPPILLIAIGLHNGSIYCIKEDIARERITRFKLQVEIHFDKSQSSITGLGFRVDGQALQLFAVTPSSLSLFILQNQPSNTRRQTLDQIGSNINSVAMRDRSMVHVLLSVKLKSESASSSTNGTKKNVCFRSHNESVLMKITEVFITEYFCCESGNNKTFFFVLLVDDEADSDMRFTEGELLAVLYGVECEPCA